MKRIGKIGPSITQSSARDKQMRRTNVAENNKAEATLRLLGNCAVVQQPLRYLS